MSNLFTFECPFCGKNSGDITIIKDKFDEYAVVCISCGCQGPVALTEEKATLYWNDLPRRWQWSSDIPKVSGYYFVREKDSSDNCILYFSSLGNFFLNGNRKINLNNLIDFEFLGPINPYDTLKTKENS